MLRVCLEYAVSDLRKMLHEKPADASRHGNHEYSQELMVKLAVEIARGLTYIHSMEQMHLDLKPENVLLARDGEEWIAKVADFGAQVEKASDQPATAGAHHNATGTFSVTLSYSMHSTDPNKVSPIGTYEYMPPECWKRKFGEPG
eukprot:COSAG04_NODE_6018_length_1431_cov_0.930180_2_plen_145_part_00